MQPKPRPQPSVRLPRSAAVRGAATYVKLIRAVKPDYVWGGWNFEGTPLPPGAQLVAGELPEPALAIECAGPTGRGWGHARRPTLYILWRFDRHANQWVELARAASADRDWTADLGPIARRELAPPRPVLVDPQAAAGRVMEALEREMEPVDRGAQRLILLAVYDQVAARVAGAN